MARLGSLAGKGNLARSAFFRSFSGDYSGWPGRLALGFALPGTNQRRPSIGRGLAHQPASAGESGLKRSQDRISPDKLRDDDKLEKRKKKARSNLWCHQVLSQKREMLPLGVSLGGLWPFCCEVCPNQVVLPARSEEKCPRGQDMICHRGAVVREAVEIRSQWW